MPNDSTLTLENHQRIRERWTDPQFAGARDALVQRADAALAADLRPVGEAGGWGHAFYCPDHVVQLDFDPTGPASHRCPTDGRLWSGEDFDGGWRCALNGRIQGGIQACARVWQATGDEHYLAYPREVLLDYAERYPGLPEFGHWAGKGRVTGQSLEEAVWGISTARTYAAIAESLTDEERNLIERDLLRGVADHVTGQLMGKIHNIECWHLSSLINLGVVLRDDDLVDAAVDGEFGMTAQLAEGIMADGWWAEGSPHYHYYMLAAALNAASALQAPRPAFLDTPGLREMLTTPLSMMRADYSLPAMNDGWNSMTLPLGVAEHAAHYEQAYGLWHDERFADFLADVYGRGVPRTAEAALTMGPDLSDHRQATTWARRTVHPASGYAVLADGEGPVERYLLLKYGQHGGGHGHPDKLQLDLHAYGVRLAPDAGSPAYISPLQGPWVRQTLSHNTVVLDHTSQPEAEGRLITHLDPGDASIGVMDATVSWPTDPTAANGRPGSWLKEPRLTHVPAYAGATIRRTVLWKPGTGGYFLDLVQVGAPTEVPIDLVWHHRGNLVSPAPSELINIDWTPPNETYAFLSDVQRLDPVSATAGTAVPGSVSGNTWRAAWEIEGAGTRVWAYDPPGSTTLVAHSPSNPPAEVQTTTLRRVGGRHAVFASIVEPTQGDPLTDGSITQVHWSGTLDDDTLSVQIEQGAHTDTWSIRRGAADQTAINGVSGTIDCTLGRQPSTGW